jgi:hypothetical protein
MNLTFREAVNGLDETSFQRLYGRWDPMPPERLADLLADCGVRWQIAGGLAARAGAPPRHHGDTDVTIRAADFGAIRAVIGDWHLWEVDDGALRPLLPGVALAADCEELWVRREASQPWRFELLLDRQSTDAEWVYKRDARVRLPWDKAVHAVGGVEYLRPELALLFKAKHDRPKDRADLLAARLDPATRRWLADTLDLLGHPEWARLTRRTKEDGDMTTNVPEPAGEGSDVFGQEQGGTDEFGPESGGTDEFGPESGDTDEFGPESGGTDEFGPETGGTDVMSPPQS